MLNSWFGQGHIIGHAAPLVLLTLILIPLCFDKRDAYDSIYKPVGILALILSAFSVVLNAITIIVYAIYPNYFDHFEATVAALSAYSLAGHTLYPRLESGHFYEAPYGPLLFLINGWVGGFIPSILGSKIAGIASYLAFFVLFAYYLARLSMRAITTPILALGILTSLFLFLQYDSYAFWNRAEPFLILCGFLGLLVVERLPMTWAALSLGVLFGAATGMKLHGGIYLFPALMGLCGSITVPRERMRILVLCAAMAVPLCILPFWMMGGWETVSSYAAVLAMTSGHHFLAILLLENLLIVGFLLCPIVTLLVLCRPKLPSDMIWSLVGLVGALIVAALIGSKAGAGPHHLMPLIPIALYMLMRCGAAISGPTIGLGHTIIAATAMSALLSYTLINTKRATSTLAALSRVTTETAKVQELVNLADKYPGSEIGVSDDEHFTDTFYKALLVFRSDSYTFDFSSWMDYDFSGRSDAPLVGALDRCAVAQLILPKGSPFTISNFYDAQPLMSGAFVSKFRERYRSVETGRFYDVWKCFR